MRREKGRVAFLAATGECSLAIFSRRPGFRLIDRSAASCGRGRRNSEAKKIHAPLDLSLTRYFRFLVQRRSGGVRCNFSGARVIPGNA